MHATIIFFNLGLRIFASLTYAGQNIPEFQISIWISDLKVSYYFPYFCNEKRRDSKAINKRFNTVQLCTI